MFAVYFNYDNYLGLFVSVFAPVSINNTTHFLCWTKIVGKYISTSEDSNKILFKILLADYLLSFYVVSVVKIGHVPFFSFLFIRSTKK